MQISQLELKTILYNHTLFLKNLDFGKRARFVGMDLSGADLSRADLTSAVLDGCNLQGANLYHAKFHRAEFCETDLTGANLSHAEFHGANMTGAKMIGANLHSAKLKGTYLPLADLSHANLSNADLEYADLSDSKMCGASLRYTTFAGTNLYKAEGIRYLDMSDPRGYIPVAVAHEDGWHISSGCRWFSMEDALEHWNPYNEGVSNDYVGDPETGARYLRAINALPECPPVPEKL